MTKTDCLDLTDIYQKVGKRYHPRPDLQALAQLDPHTLIIGTTRYYLGRMTIAANHFAKYELAKAWPLIPPYTRAILQRDIEEAFQRDDKARADGLQYFSLGMDCDRAAWQTVRNHWQGQDTPPAAQRVPTPKEISRRLRLLSEQMQELGAAMEYTAGFDGVMAERGKELLGAGLIAVGWAAAIEDGEGQPLVRHDVLMAEAKAKKNGEQKS